jgi:hypothetical protein
LFIFLNIQLSINLGGHTILQFASMLRFIHTSVVFFALFVCPQASSQSQRSNSAPSNISLPVNLTGDCVAMASKFLALSTPALPRHANLHLAAAENCAESACLLLMQGADINARNK